MKKLTNYKKNNYEFALVHREGDLAIFRGESRDHGAENWEVIKIQAHNGREAFGAYLPPAEYAPSNEDWGTNGWTALNSEHAKTIFNREKGGV